PHLFRRLDWKDFDCVRQIIVCPGVVIDGSHGVHLFFGPLRGRSQIGQGLVFIDVSSGTPHGIYHALFCLPGAD
ncbi:MAG TPA: hypothetical protein VGC82_03060, partial [Rhodopila sp.]